MIRRAALAVIAVTAFLCGLGVAAALTAAATPEPVDVIHPFPVKEHRPCGDDKCSTPSPSPSPDLPGEATPEPEPSPEPEPGPTPEPSVSPQPTSEPEPSPSQEPSPSPSPSETSEPSPTPTATSEPEPEPSSSSAPTPSPTPSPKPPLECPEGKVPGWLDENGDPTSCVDDDPNPWPTNPPPTNPDPGVDELAETGPAEDLAALAGVALVLVMAGAAIARVKQRRREDGRR